MDNSHQAASAGRRSWVLTVLGLAVLVAGFVFLAFQVKDWMLDDAFISFRYAENLVRGDGLVYNPGERVEGYTNFLWTLILSAAHALGADTTASSRALGLLFGVLTLLLCWYAAQRQQDSMSVRSLIAPLLLVTLVLFPVWCLSGMEVTLLAFLVLLGVLLAALPTPGSAGRLASGLVLALAAMTRPEGLMVAVFCLVTMAAFRDQEANTGRRVGLALAALAALYLPYYAWRFTYYGYPLPNTFYAKVGFSVHQVSRGLGYLWDFVKSCPLLPAWAALGAAVGWRQPLFRLAALCSLGFLTYAVAVGGDCMPAFRFIAPTAPLLCLLAAAGLTWLEEKLHAARPAGQAIALNLIVVLATAGVNLFTTLRHPMVLMNIRQDRVVHYGRIAGTKLRRMARPDAVVATNTAGTIPYYSGLRTIDMLGMNDRHIAHMPMLLGKGRAGHERADGAYVLSRRPDYIQFCSSWGSLEPFFRGDSEVFASPEFRAHYQFRHYPLEGDLRLALWERKPE
jgi:hypothetical protein